jgi:hypothetical protein
MKGGGGKRGEEKERGGGRRSERGRGGEGRRRAEEGQRVMDMMEAHTNT